MTAIAALSESRTHPQSTSALKRRAVRLGCGLLLAALCGLSLPAMAQEVMPRTVLVVDSSERMQATLEGRPKRLVLNTSIATVLPRFAGRLELGLVAFGHGKGERCRDVDMLVPPQALDVAKVSDGLAGLRPGGPAGVARSLEIAARRGGLEGAASSIVIVSSSGDACDQDPCATAQILKQSRDIRIHVIAIDDGLDKDSRTLKCLAKRTGGSFVRVTKASELVAALDQALEAAASATPGTAADDDADAVPAPAEAAGPDAAAAGGDAPGLLVPPDPLLQPTAPPELAAEPFPDQPTAAVSLTALLADPGPQITDGLVWRLFEATPSSDGSFRLIGTYKSAAPVIKLPTGSFLVNVAYGRANVTRRISVDAAKASAEQFVLNAGGLKLAAVLPDGQALAAKSVICDIYSDERDQFGNRTKLLSGVRPGLVVRLNSGLYHVVSTYGDANAIVSGDVSIEAGKLTEARLTHDGAKITFKLVQTAGGEALADTRWTIATPEGVVVKESVGALPSHILAAGRYTIVAERGGQKFSGTIEVEPVVPKQIELLAAGAQ